MWMHKGKVSPSEAARLLRDLALSGSSASDDMVRSAVVMESGFQRGVATLVSFADGATALYFSGGAGMVAERRHLAVGELAAEFRSLADGLLPHFAPAADDMPPDMGFVRFFRRDAADLLSAEVGESELRADRHSLAPLYRAGQRVVGALRDALAEDALARQKSMPEQERSN